MSTTHDILSISTALVTKLLVIEPLLHPVLKSAVSASWHNFQLCPLLATNPGDATVQTYCYRMSTWLKSVWVWEYSWYLETVFLCFSVL